jgi:hypothetical protein
MAHWHDKRQRNGLLVCEPLLEDFGSSFWPGDGEEYDVLHEETSGVWEWDASMLSRSQLRYFFLSPSESLCDVVLQVG